MAKRRAPTRSLNRDTRPNRYRGRITLAAAGGTAVETFNTGMQVGQASPYCWEVLWAFIQPNDIDDLDVVVDLAEMIWQMTIGTPAAWQDQDDVQVISSAIWGFESLAAGGSRRMHDNWPLYLPLKTPIMVLSQQISIVVTTSNSAMWNSNEFYYEIGYITRPVVDRELVEYYAQYGQA